MLIFLAAIETGSPIMIHPQFNPMIGPSTYVQINMGARFVPCMRTIPEVQNSTVHINWPCPNTTSSDSNNPSNHCDLASLCGFSAQNSAASFNEHPNQWFRFIVPLFLHAGIVHIGFNMLLQLTMGREMELAIGSLRFALVYFSSGIFGFVLGGNFAATAIASTGASGCLFGILALTLLDLIYCWKERPSPVKDLMWILGDVLVSFVLGLLPGLDNFSHIGGFLMGLVLGICILHSPNPLRQRIGLAPVPYSPMPSDPKRPTTAVADPLGNFTKQPVGFFKGRKPLWWAWWLLRAGALIGALISLVVLLNNFYKYRDTCSWCKYLSCLPINHWCNIGNLQLTNTTTNKKLKRDLILGVGEIGTGLAKGLWEIAQI
jgi:membrane associated rhomboid family serine protease